MKIGIHPPYQKFKILLNKDMFQTNSTLKTSEMIMDIDFRQHPAWNQQKINNVNQTNKNISNFNTKFPGLNIKK